MHQLFKLIFVAGKMPHPGGNGILMPPDEARVRVPLPGQRRLNILQVSRFHRTLLSPPPGLLSMTNAR
ncbi:MAG: hypothetical protein LLG01_06005 [Planctomycetaceae bacterium]|nr:hypothetical protein [Planctomycetaceae bacterium]